MNEWMKQSVQVIFNNYFQFRHAKIMGEQLLHIGSMVSERSREVCHGSQSLDHAEPFSDNVNGFCLNLWENEFIAARG